MTTAIAWLWPAALRQPVDGACFEQPDDGITGVARLSGAGDLKHEKP